MRKMLMLVGAALALHAGSPASAATLAGTAQVWQGGDWAVEATPYWCRAYPASAKKNADGIPAVALIQWDGKVYLEFGLPRNKGAESKTGTVHLKIDGAKTAVAFSQTSGTRWGTVYTELGAIMNIRAGKTMRLKSGIKWSAGYSLRGSSKAMDALNACADDLLAKGKAGLEPMERQEPNRKLQARSSPASWIPMSAYPRGIHRPVEGTAGFHLSVSTDGRPTNCKVTISAGDADLDAATCSNAMKRAKFIAATDGYGYPVPSEYSGQVRWEYPK